MVIGERDRSGEEGRQERARERDGERARSLISAIIFGGSRGIVDAPRPINPPITGAARCN